MRRGIPRRRNFTRRARVIATPETAPVYGAYCQVVPTRQPIVMVHYKIKPGGQVSYGPVPVGASPLGVSAHVIACTHR